MPRCAPRPRLWPASEELDHLEVCCVVEFISCGKGVAYVQQVDQQLQRSALLPEMLVGSL